MKAIQSFRSNSMRPALESFGGPSLVKIQLQMMALSAVTIAKYYPNFEFITDDAGKEMAERCKLPYSKITSIGENFDSDEVFSIHSKFVAYSSSEPFLQFDRDVLLWKPLPARCEQAGILAVHPETSLWPFYEDRLDSLGVNCSWVPKLDYKYFANKSAINMAVFGGNNIAVINKYAEHVLNFVKSVNGFRDLPPTDRSLVRGTISPIIENLWASYLIQSEYGHKVEYIMREREAFTNDGAVAQLTHLHGLKLADKETDLKKKYEIFSQIFNGLRRENSVVYDAVEAYTTVPESTPEPTPETTTQLIEETQNA